MTATPTRIALVTGGSRGLGRSSALKLAEQGVDILLTYKSNEAEARAVVQAIEALGRRAVALPLDVGDSRSLAAFAQHVKATLSRTWQRERFDHLVNNAGVGAHASFAETTEEQLPCAMRAMELAVAGHTRTTSAQAARSRWGTGALGSCGHSSVTTRAWVNASSASTPTKRRALAVATTRTSKPRRCSPSTIIGAYIDATPPVRASTRRIGAAAAGTRGADGTGASTTKCPLRSTSIVRSTTDS